MTELNINRIWDLLLFMFAAGLVVGFLFLASDNTVAGDLAKVLFGAFLAKIGSRGQ